MKDAKVVSLAHIPCGFIAKQLTLNEGTYIFEIPNNAVGHTVRFVLAKKGSDLADPENHIQRAWVTE